jgi:uncharacterized membrane protein YhaH (DUF805 family)
MKEPTMQFDTAIKTCFRKYADFSGRATRPEYWFFFLLSLALGVAAVAIHPFFGLLQLACVIPHLAAGCRRLHDIGKSGWFLLISLVPVLGLLVLLYFLSQPGDPATNTYGPPPAGVAASG